MSVTKSNKSQQLTIEQENAIDLLIIGKSDREVSESVKVNRSTVNQWQNHNPFFVAELNRRRKSVWGSGEERLRSLVSSAVDVLEEDLNSEDLKLRQSSAIHILKSVGMYGQDLQPRGYTTPDAIADSWNLGRGSSLIYKSLLGEYND
jgi:hypothetical protein